MQRVTRAPDTSPSELSVNVAMEFAVVVEFRGMAKLVVRQRTTAIRMNSRWPVFDLLRMEGIMKSVFCVVNWSCRLGRFVVEDLNGQLEQSFVH